MCESWKGDPNATLSGQGVPQYAPGTDPRLSAGLGGHAPSPGPLTAGPPNAPPSIAAVPHDPATGNDRRPDGRTYTQSDLADSAKGDRTWQSMLILPSR
jgi:phospholipid/cholesterol/gamma-HCH transport system substrate-binding protein